MEITRSYSGRSRFSEINGSLRYMLQGNDRVNVTQAVISSQLSIIRKSQIIDYYCYISITEDIPTYTSVMYGILHQP